MTILSFTDHLAKSNAVKHKVMARLIQNGVSLRDRADIIRVMFKPSTTGDIK